MDRRYLRVADGPGVKRGQLDWISVRDRCNGNMTCLTTAYHERNAYLATLPVNARPAVAAESVSPPIRHLFLMHSPAQLLAPATAKPAALAQAVSASDQLNRAAGPPPAEAPPQPWHRLWFLAGLLFVSVVLWQMLTNVCGKCPNCHHWFAKVEIDQRRLATDPSELPDIHRRGLRPRATASRRANTDSTRDRVAAVRHYNQCRMCLHEWETTSQQTK